MDTIDDVSPMEVIDHQRMETAALVAPVTAVEFLQDAFLLTGEGPVLTVFNLHPRPEFRASLSVLQHYRIHGIRPQSLKAVPAQRSATGTSGKKRDESSSTSEPKFYDLALFGGKAVRLVRLHVDLQDGEHLRLEILGPLTKLQDWALDVRWLCGDKRSLLCVAVAHNSALLLDIVTGNVLFQRSCLEGCLLYSALLLVHKSWADTVLVGGTVFNQLVLWRPGGGGDKGDDSEHQVPVERRLLGHSGVIFSISYLQETGWLASASDDRSVRVWGVGALGGPEGKCGDVNPACLRVLYGHQARVFSVRLSPGNVFSAGEDGACLVWDWAGGGKVVRTLKGHRAGGVRALAVSEGTGDQERWVATGGADGGVRLWRVKGSEEGKEKTEDAVTEKLTDLKFPSHGLPKVVCMAGEEDTNASWSQSKFLVCTDQGTVYQYSEGQWEMVWQGTPEFHSFCVMETITARVKGSTAKVNLCSVGNLSGAIQVFPISHPQCGISLTGGPGKIHSLIWREAKDSTYLLASGSEGLVYRWCIDVESGENSSLALSVNPLPPFLLPPCAKCWLTAAVRLHSTSRGSLWVCGDRRGSLLLFQEGGTQEQKMGDDERMDEGWLTSRKQTGDDGVEGSSRKSEMKEERERKEVGDLTLRPLSCLFGVHGKQGVTSVREYQLLLYSTGRDGCVRVFRVSSPVAPQQLEEKSDAKGVENKGGLQLEVLRVQRACKGMEWLERVLILESDIPAEEEESEEERGEECKNHFTIKKQNLTGKLELPEEREEKGSFRGEDQNKGREARFAIIGFHGVHFVVWDPVRQERLFAVPCGGGHRSWRLWPSHKGVWSGHGALVFIKQGAVMASHPPGEAPSWAGKVGRTGGWGLREGVHGRGIGCVCRLGAIRGTGDEMRTNQAGDLTRTEGREEEHWEIVVTGGEDTSLTVLAVRPASGSVKVLSVITDHISSVRTVTAVTRPQGGGDDQTRPLSALLVSAGGRAQMQCYRLSVGWDRQRLVPTCQVTQVAGHRLDEQWERRRNRHKTVKMDPETRYMSLVAVDGETDGCLLALACSDGALRLFSVSEVKRQIELLWETFHHQRCVLSVAACILEDRKGNRSTLLFSAATDGKIAVWDLTDASSLSAGTSSRSPAPPIPRLDVHAHQSGINSLAVWTEDLGHQEGGCLVTVASGGDDGQLTVSTIWVQYPDDGAQLQSPNQLHLHLSSQSRVALAHAAPLTALKLLSPDLVVSTSPDQRVCLWRVGRTDIRHIGALFCHVADAAGLAVWEGKMTEEEEEGDKNKKTRFECEQEIAIWRWSQTGLKATCQTAAQFNKDTKTADEAEDGEPVGSASETGNPVCQTSNEKGGETAGECRHQTEAHSSGEMESGVNTEAGFKASCESKRKRGKTGWVLVCGQGLQLLRVPNTEKDAEMWATRRAKELK